MKDESPPKVALKDEEQGELASKPRELKERTNCFALSIIRLCGSLPKTVEAQVLGKQVLRSGTSVGAHYREAQRAKSDADLISKMEGALQELDETDYWLELIVESGVLPPTRDQPLLKETDELISIFVTIVTKIKRKPK